MMATAFLGYEFSLTRFTYVLCEGSRVPSLIEFSDLHLAESLKVAKDTLNGHERRGLLY